MEEFVEVSAQGSLFRLKKDFILSHDWLVATMLTTKIGSIDHNHVLYVDVDPVIFRMLLLTLQERLDLCATLPKLSMMEITLLRSNAEYLLLSEIASVIESFENETNNEIKRLKQLVDAYEKKNDQIEKMVRIIDGNHVQIFSCSSFRESRSYNICGSKSIVIGPITFPDSGRACTGAHLKCSKNCRKEKHIIWKAKELHKFEDLTELFDILNDND
jgi:hypothetical protein